MVAFSGCLASVSACVKWQASVLRAPPLHGQPQVILNTCSSLQFSQYILTWFQKPKYVPFSTENSETWNPSARLNLRPLDWLSQRFVIWCNYLVTLQSMPLSESCAKLPGLIFPEGGFLGSCLDLGQGWQRGVLEALQVQLSILILLFKVFCFKGYLWGSSRNWLQYQILISW